MFTDLEAVFADLHEEFSISSSYFIQYPLRVQEECLEKIGHILLQVRGDKSAWELCGMRVTKEEEKTQYLAHFVLVPKITNIEDPYGSLAREEGSCRVKVSSWQICEGNIILPENSCMKEDIDNIQNLANTIFLFSKDL